MQGHYEYIMNPGNELQSVRAAGFFFLLGFNIKSAVVNLLQIPQVGYPYLAVGSATPERWRSCPWQ